MELRVLCVRCKAVAVFSNINPKDEAKKLYCDAEHYLGTVGKVLAEQKR